MSTSATPAMRQYLDAKQQHRDAIMFFRMGDFYEMFYEDALVASRALELTLTSRSKDAAGGAVPMCGVPFHAVDGYIARLVKKGFRVAICDQVEDPRKAKGIVKREVVRVVSPGTLTDAGYLDAREPAFLMAVTVVGGDLWGAALLDLSTGAFTAAEYAGRDGVQALADEIATLKPREIVAPTGLDLATPLPAIATSGVPVTPIDAWMFDVESARRSLVEQLRTAGLAGFGLDGHPAAVAAAGALVQHLRGMQKAELAHVRAITYRQRTDALTIDPTTLRHLEIVDGAEGGRKGSLLDEIDVTVTAMGSRMLRSWLLAPLVAVEPIRGRLDAVEALTTSATVRGTFREAMKAVQDLERLIARVALGTAGPRDFAGLQQSLSAAPRIRTSLAEVQSALVGSLVAEIDDLADVRHTIEAAIVDEPPALTRDGGFVRDGVDRELDDLRAISRSGKQVIAEMEARERVRTGIGSLKVRYNRVFGYYIEISKSNLGAVPSDYHRKQTIAGGERFITPALKEYEEKVLGADERILERELEIFDELGGKVAAEAPRIQTTSRALATLDVLAALAQAAAVGNYVKPHVHDGDDLVVLDGRHPVVERRTAAAGSPFVPNDVSLNGTTSQIVILTGPNMGGKSTYLRQTALLVIMAQAGSFVPAREARVPIVDRIFARVGAIDDIARGHSTFMVEMQETASILHHATSRSLVVLDEIGRGTATFDGLSIAWAVAEHLATNPTARPKTLFATHYHEMTDLADATPGVVNFHVSAREWKDDIIFLRKIVPGRSDRSYGIQVARLAGLPRTVVDRAREILSALERDELGRGGRPSMSATETDPQMQLGLFRSAPVADPLRERLASIDVDRMTPLDALALLAEIKKEAAE
ncbi:MAG: DNA mismatch repair protein MutS [Acidobacteria bacterium RIFCSPLOWO2_12_FULL_65_11]|nr:MAG: DNA mismatch repair protein MutS [Acidobacteria bacterium RIFCSPLOWO2_02_FULL_64_15]OFW32264.1 MAG: DNA mismatch repair protein MutS [Acidobacteria bacterium RIFCSPLOWO2_12_FULL_65_11]